MTDPICPDCGQPMRERGPQKFLTRGTVVDLADCKTADCLQFERTRSFNERPLPDQEIAAARELLKRTVAMYGARAPK